MILQVQFIDVWHENWEPSKIYFPTNNIHWGVGHFTTVHTCQVSQNSRANPDKNEDISYKFVFNFKISWKPLA